jgi:hypothetical protein
MIIGYARVSTTQQDYEGQIAALKAAGAERVFTEKVGGAVTDRREYTYYFSSQITPDDELPFVIQYTPERGRAEWVNQEALNLLGKS